MSIPFPDVHALNDGREERRQKIVAVPDDVELSLLPYARTSLVAVSFVVREIIVWWQNEPSSFFDLDFLGPDLLILTVTNNLPVSRAFFIFLLLLHVSSHDTASLTL